MKRKTMMAFMAALCIGSSMTAYAAPETMPDGTVFDADYYAQSNPDVAASVGLDADALYQHYKLYGEKEGRAAYDTSVSDETQNAIPSTNVAVKKLLKRRVSYHRDNSVDGYETYSYDIQGNLISEASYNNLGDQTILNIYSYDNQGNKIKEEHLDGSYILYTYDNHDNLIREEEYISEGIVCWDTEYRYDSQDNKIEETVYWHGSYYLRDTFSYDSQGNITEEKHYAPNGDFSGRYVYRYDSYGNLIKKEKYESDGHMPGYHEYSYDSQGNLTDEKYIWCGGLLEHYTYSYGVQGNLSRKDEYHYANLNGPGGSLISQNIYYYDDNGDMTREEWYDEFNDTMFMHLYFLYEY